MAHVSASDLAYAHPGGDELFRDVSFTLSPGACVGVVGANGVGKSTLLRILAGELEPTEGATSLGASALHMAQDVGSADDGSSVRELLLAGAPHALARAGRAMARAERELAAGDDEAGMRLGTAIGEWSELGGYELEAAWDEACRRIVGGGLSEVGDRPAATLSGGERKQLVLEVLFAADARVLLLDEPDNFLDIPAKRALEARLRATSKTVLVISHDRELLSVGVSSILTLEGDGCWLHGGSYATYPAARAARQERLGDALKRWRDEELRLRELTRTFKERARYSPDWAKKANAMETRWKRFRDEGAPPAPVAERTMAMRIRGGDSARRVVRLRGLGIDGLVAPFDEEVHFGERVGLVGPNGTGKSHLLRLLAGEQLDHSGAWELGPRVSPGLFTQLNARPDWAGRTTLDVVQRQTGNLERAMQGLARYGLAEAAQRPVDVLSGGQRARLEVLGLELAGHNLLLLDEPTDNLDLGSSEALEEALESFTGTVVAVSHDRTFLQRLDRFLHLGRDGRISRLADPARAVQVLAGAAG